MNYATHSLGGIAAGLLVMAAAPELPTEGRLALLGGAVLGSLFPDVDHRGSWVSKRIPLASAVVSSMFKHRGFLHTPIFIGIMAAVMPLISVVFLKEQMQYAVPFIMGFLPGMLSHLMLDTCNVAGIMWLWPMTSKKFSLMPIRTGSVGEAAFMAVLGAAVAWGVQSMWL